MARMITLFTSPLNNEAANYHVVARLNESARAEVD